MKIAVLSERGTSFHAKYLARLVPHLLGGGAEVVVICGEPLALPLPADAEVLIAPEFAASAQALGGRGYAAAFRVALERGACHIHSIFLLDPQRLFLAIEADARVRAVGFSHSIFGLADYLRKPTYRTFHERLLDLRCVRRAFVHSNHPAVTRGVAEANGILMSGKVAWLHDPIYDDPIPFAIDRASARARLRLPQDVRIALYYGTFPYKKGADLLAEAARRIGDHRPGVLFVFAGSLATAPPDFPCAALRRPNVLVDDRFIDEETAASYFAAADLVVQPYRRHYEFDTSGVLVQACLAGRPTLVPNFTPFRETVTQFALGGTFEPEDVDDLAHNVLAALEARPSGAAGGWDDYLRRIEGWDDLARSVLDAAAG